MSATTKPKSTPSKAKTKSKVHTVSAEVFAAREHIARVHASTRDPTNSSIASQTLREMYAAVDAFARRIDSAKSIEDFIDCVDNAEILYTMSTKISITDDYATMSLTDCRNHCRDAIDALLVHDVENFEFQHQCAKDALQSFRDGI